MKFPPVVANLATKFIQRPFRFSRYDIVFYGFSNIELKDLRKISEFEITNPAIGCCQSTSEVSDRVSNIYRFSQKFDAPEEQHQALQKPSRN